MTKTTLKIIEEKNNFLRNTVIIACSAIGSCILFYPAKDFGSIAAAFFSACLPSENFAVNIGMLCGISSVGATTILGFNSWDKILSIPDKKLSAIAKRVTCYLGGLITSAPLMLDTFQINQNSNSFLTNLILTILPGIFMSGVYGHSIEFLYNEFTKKNTEAFDKTNSLQNRFALHIGIFLGTVSAIGCYWESLNALSSLAKASMNITISAYILSALPVICRAPLFIVSAYQVAKKILVAYKHKEGLSFTRLLFLVGVVLFSIFTIGGYSDIAHNGMSQSYLFQSSAIFHDFLYPLILGTAMFCMLLLNADALITASDRAAKYLISRRKALKDRSEAHISPSHTV